MNLLNKYDKYDADIEGRFNDGSIIFLINYNIINFVFPSQHSNTINKLSINPLQLITLFFSIFIF